MQPRIFYNVNPRVLAAANSSDLTTTTNTAETTSREESAPRPAVPPMSENGGSAPPPVPPPDAPATATEADGAPEVAAASAAEALPSTRSEKAGVPALSKDDGKVTMTKEEMVKEALNCPCIANMKEGPCGTHFLSAYECFLRSESEPQGADCFDNFVAMQTCMTEHPDDYNLDDEDEQGAGKPKSKAEDSNIAPPPASMPPPADVPVQPTPVAASPFELAVSSNFVGRGLQRMLRRLF